MKVRFKLSETPVKKVAQISNLLCRRIPFCQTFTHSGHREVPGSHADWKSAIQQIGNLRYDHRLEATVLLAAVV